MCLSTNRFDRLCNMHHFCHRKNYLEFDDIVYFKYAPITSVDVERSFSAFKTILSNNRRAFEFENLRKHLIIQCNREGKKHFKIHFFLN